MWKYWIIYQVSHLAPQKQTYTIKKISVPLLLLLFFSSHGRVLEELSLLKKLHPADKRTNTYQGEYLRPSLYARWDGAIENHCRKTYQILHWPQGNCGSSKAWYENLIVELSILVNIFRRRRGSELKRSFHTITFHLLKFRNR